MQQNKDNLLREIADYVVDYEVEREEDFETARYVLMDAVGSGILALRYPECTKLLGPIVSDVFVRNGTRVPGTSFELDPVQGAFNIGTMIRWLDYNDTWLAREWGHPSDNIGAILAVTDYISRKQRAEGKQSFKVKDVLASIIKAHEIQGILSLDNSLNRHGLDHVLFVKIASTAVVTHLLGGTKEQIMDALSNAWIDNGSLRVYRHYPNAGSRKSWAAGDAASRAVRLALMTMRGEMGYNTPLTTEGWGVEDVLFNGNKVTLQQTLGSYVINNVLFKVSFPAEFHAQTAVEASIQLHPSVRDNLDQIERIEIVTHEAAVRIIDKKGPLSNPADRDHCLQYMVSVGLIHGTLRADHYEEAAASDPLIDTLRSKMDVTENPEFSRDYLDPEKRSIPNQITIYFADGTSTEPVLIEYPLGHRRRRQEAAPLIVEKCKENIQTHFPGHQAEQLMTMLLNPALLYDMSVPDFMKEWLI